jgi:hypothetical protein
VLWLVAYSGGSERSAARRGSHGSRQTGPSWLLLESARNRGRRRYLCPHARSRAGARRRSLGPSAPDWPPARYLNGRCVRTRCWLALVRSSFAPGHGPGPAEAACALPRWTSTRTFVASLMRPASALAPTAADAKLRGKRVFRHDRQRRSPCRAPCRDRPPRRPHVRRPAGVSLLLCEGQLLGRERRIDSVQEVRRNARVSCAPDEVVALVLLERQRAFDLAGGASC